MKFNYTRCIWNQSDQLAYKDMQIIKSKWQTGYLCVMSVYVHGV